MSTPFIEVVTGDQKGQFCSTCGYLTTTMGLIPEGCVCYLQKRHQPDCRFLKAAQLQIELVCDHGYQACPECDPCTCNPPVREGGIR